MRNDQHHQIGPIDLPHAHVDRRARHGPEGFHASGVLLHAPQRREQSFAVLDRVLAGRRNHDPGHCATVGLAASLVNDHSFGATGE
jgi:hypothetical protein